MIATLSELVDNIGRLIRRELGPGMKVRDVICWLAEDGGVQVSQKGSHRHFKHLIKRGKRCDRESL
jgi:hypothetical protein